jgi:hypothetical protein
LKKILALIIFLNILTFGQYHSQYTGSQIDSAVTAVRGKSWPSSNVTVTGWQQTLIESGLIYVKGLTSAGFKDSTYTFYVYTDSVFNDPDWTYTDSLGTDTTVYDSSKIEVAVKIKTNASFTSLGGSTIVLQFDSTDLSIGHAADTTYHIYTDTLYAVYNETDSTYSDTVVVTDTTLVISTMDSTDYVFNNFSGGNYDSATATRPYTNVVWLNITLPAGEVGSSVGSQSWSYVATLTFDVIGEAVNPATQVFTWLTTSPFFGIFDSNNLSLWNTHEITSQ